MTKTKKPAPAPEIMLDEFTKGYIECALWSSTDESTPAGGEPMDQSYSLADFAPEALVKIKDDCAKFQDENAELLEEYYSEIKPREGTPQGYAGHDFWLSRNGHGAGFFDRGLSADLDDLLQEAARAAGNCDLYIGDDKKVHVM